MLTPSKHTRQYANVAVSGERQYRMSEQQKLTALQKAELGAMCGDRDDTLLIVNGLREYRALVKEILNPAFIRSLKLKCEFETEVAQIEEEI